MMVPLQRCRSIGCVKGATCRALARPLGVADACDAHPFLVARAPRVRRSRALPDGEFALAEELRIAQVLLDARAQFGLDVLHAVTIEQMAQKAPVEIARAHHPVGDRE